MVPVRVPVILSSYSYKWTPKEVVGHADKTVYILLEKQLRDEVSMHAWLIVIWLVHITINQCKIYCYLLWLSIIDVRLLFIPVINFLKMTT